MSGCANARAYERTCVETLCVADLSVLTTCSLTSVIARFWHCLNLARYVAESLYCGCAVIYPMLLSSLPSNGANWSFNTDNDGDFKVCVNLSSSVKCESLWRATAKCHRHDCAQVSEKEQASHVGSLSRTSFAGRQLRVPRHTTARNTDLLDSDSPKLTSSVWSLTNCSHASCNVFVFVETLDLRRHRIKAAPASSVSLFPHICFLPKMV